MKVTVDIGGWTDGGFTRSVRAWNIEEDLVDRALAALTALGERGLILRLEIYFHADACGVKTGDCAACELIKESAGKHETSRLSPRTC